MLWYSPRFGPAFLEECAVKDVTDDRLQAARATRRRTTGVEASSGGGGGAAAMLTAAMADAGDGNDDSAVDTMCSDILGGGRPPSREQVGPGGPTHQHARSHSPPLGRCNNTNWRTGVCVCVCVCVCVLGVCVCWV